MKKIKKLKMGLFMAVLPLCCGGAFLATKGQEETLPVFETTIESKEFFAQEVPDFYTIPTLENITYSPTRTLEDISLGEDPMGTWSWINPAIIPTVAVSSYQALFTPTDFQNFTTVVVNVPLTVEKANVVIDYDAIQTEYEYTGSEFTISSGAEHNNTDEGAELVYSNNTFRDVNDYQMTISIAETDNYNQAEVTVDIKVDYAELDVFTISNADSVYFVGETFNEFGYDYEVKFNDSDVEGSLQLNWNNEYTDVAQGMSQTREIKFTFTPTDSNIRPSTQVVSVEYRHIVAEFYNGSSRVKTNHLNYNSTLERPSAPTQYHKYFSCWLLNDEMYNFEATVKEDIRLDAKFVTAPVLDKVVYDPTKTLADIELPANFSWKNAETTPVVSISSYEAVFTKEDSYYGVNNINLALAVEKAEVEIDTTNVQKIYTFADIDYTVNSGATHNNTDTGATLVYSNNTFKNAGTYTVEISIVQTDNYKAKSVYVDVIVEQIDFELDADNISIKDLVVGEDPTKAHLIPLDSEAELYLATYKGEDITDKLTLSFTYNGGKPTVSGDFPERINVVFTPEDTNLKPQTKTLDANYYFLVVTFLNHDDSLLDILTTVTYGQNVRYPNDTPTKTSTAEFDYIFTGWSESLDSVTQSKTVKAEYVPQTRIYDVNFFVENKKQNYDLVSEQKISYGQKATFVNEPAIEGKVFDGWRVGSEEGELFNFDEDVIEGELNIFASFVNIPTITGLVYQNGRKLADIELPANFSWKVSETQPETGTKEYAAKYAYFNGKENKEKDNISISVTIAKSPINTSQITFSDLEVVYDGEQHSLEAVNVPTYLSVEYSELRLINVGRYEIVATFKTSDLVNYIDATETKTAFLTIKAKTVKITGENVSEVTVDTTNGLEHGTTLKTLETNNQQTNESVNNKFRETFKENYVVNKVIKIYAVKNEQETSLNDTLTITFDISSVEEGKNVKLVKVNEDGTLTEIENTILENKLTFSDTTLGTYALMEEVKSNMMLYLIIGGAALAVAVAIILVVAMKKRKKKQTQKEEMVEEQPIENSEEELKLKEVEQEEVSKVEDVEVHEENVEDEQIEEEIEPEVAIQEDAEIQEETVETQPEEVEEVEEKPKKTATKKSTTSSKTKTTGVKKTTKTDSEKKTATKKTTKKETVEDKTDTNEESKQGEVKKTPAKKTSSTATKKTAKAGEEKELKKKSDEEKTETKPKTTKKSSTSKTTDSKTKSTTSKSTEKKTTAKKPSTAKSKTESTEKKTGTTKTKTKKENLS